MHESRLALCVIAMVTALSLTVACDSEESNSGGEFATPTSTDASQPLPTLDPESGIYHALTFDQAQRIVPFELIMPSPVPDSLEFVGVDVQLPPAPPSSEGTALPGGTAMWGEPTAAQFGFQPASGEEQALTFVEASTEVGSGPADSGTPLTIGDTDVIKFVMENDAGTLVSYYWEDQGLYFMLTSSIGPDLPITEQELEELIAATVES